MLNPTTRRAGFTLIEIICVMVIFAIAAAIVFAGLSSQSDLQAQAAARTVMADLLYAQNRAITTQTPVYVYFNTAGSSYSLYSPWGTAVTNPISHANYTNSWSGQNWSVSSLTLNSGGQTAMYFDVLGTPYSCDNSGGTASALSSDGKVVISSGSYSVTITIQPNTGDMSVQ